MSDEDLKEKLAKLPFRAIVAFAARCARRVRPLADVIPDDSRIVVDQAIEVSEKVARGSEVPSVAEIMQETDAVAKAARAKLPRLAANVACMAAGAAKTVSIDWDVGKIIIEIAVSALKAAIQASDEAFIETYVIPDTVAPDNADQLARDYDPDEQYEPDESPGLIESAAQSDIERLLALVLGKPGTPGSPIDPSESGPLGPLWPNGAPDWYSNPPKPTAEDQPAGSTAPPITFYFDTAEFSDEEIAVILSRLSDLYRAIGGDALVIDRTETLDPSLVLTPEEV